jgi:hypothetical protein
MYRRLEIGDTKACRLIPHKNRLVGGAIPILKNMKVNGMDYPIIYGK